MILAAPDLPRGVVLVDVFGFTVFDSSYVLPMSIPLLTILLNDLSK